MQDEKLKNEIENLKSEIKAMKNMNKVIFQNLHDIFYKGKNKNVKKYFMKKSNHYRFPTSIKKENSYADKMIELTRSIISMLKDLARFEELKDQLNDTYACKYGKTEIKNPFKTDKDGSLQNTYTKIASGYVKTVQDKVQPSMDELNILEKTMINEIENLKTKSLMNKKNENLNLMNDDELKF